jgi:hypothetical protein
MKSKYTCDERGVCQQQADCHLPCGGAPGPNRLPYAPGVIDGPVPGTKGNLVTDLIAAVIAFAAVAAVAGFATGYLSLGVF